MDVSPTSEFTVPASSGTTSHLSLERTSASEPPIGGALARAWPPAPPPKAVATIFGNHIGRAIPYSPLTKSQYVERRRSEAAQAVQEATPDGAAAPVVQEPLWMRRVGSDQHVWRSRPARWKDERGHWWHVSDLEIEEDLIHECWTVIQPDPALVWNLNILLRCSGYIAYQGRDSLKTNITRSGRWTPTRHRRRHARHWGPHHIPTTYFASQGVGHVFAWGSSW